MNALDQPNGRFVSLESGGHLMLGQTKIVHDELAAFFTATAARMSTPILRRSVSAGDGSDGSRTFVAADHRRG
jgi:hypothetical protein